MSEQTIPKVFIKVKDHNVVSITADQPVDIIVVDSELNLTVPFGTITGDGVQTPYQINFIEAVNNNIAVIRQNQINQDQTQPDSQPLT